MAFLDKFNDWYNKAVPDDTEPIITWNEPTAGTRYRWKQNLGIRLLFLVGLYAAFCLFAIARKHQSSPVAFEDRLTIATIVAVLYMVVNWATSFGTTTIFLTRNMLMVMTGRGQIRRILDSSITPFCEKLNGHNTLAFTGNNGKTMRVFLDPATEAKVLGFMTKVGFNLPPAPFG